MLSPYAPPQPEKQDHRPLQVIRAELSGSDHATALGSVAHGNAPVLGLCRKQIDTGCVDLATPLHAYRGDILCLIIRSIGEAAALEINSAGNGFRPLREPDAGPPMRQTGRGRA
jgi:hypothetical protein